MFENAVVSRDYIKSVIENRDNNDIIIDYYNKYINEVEIERKKILIGQVSNIELCNKFWQMDKYEIAKIKDYKKTTLCHDKFCANCKKVKQAVRMSRYMPELEKYKDNSYHCTFTAPVVNGDDLAIRIKHMSKCFSKFIRYLKGDKKIKGIDFDVFGYEGAVRSLEVTFKDNLYHPHYHVLFVFNGFKMGKKAYINDFSYSYGNLKNKFSIDEIMFQKIWYLLLNNKTVSKSNIESVDIGYSCKMDKLKEDDYNELFKYMTKSKNEDGNILTYENFLTLYKSLYRIKQIQGYGVLYKIKDLDDYEDMEELYIQYISELRERENPEEIIQKPRDLLKDNEFKIISRKKYYKYLKNN